MLPATEAQAVQMGLTPDEFGQVQRAIGRVPNYTELGIFSAMWSEHCSYKSSRRFLKGLPTKGARVLQGPGENAGVVDVGGGLAVAFKMESHNHPSYIEPFQGAATGVGGILRDVFTMGARPIASMNSLRFGDPKHPKTAQLVKGVVAGIAHYGNCIGVPTVGGEVQFDSSYDGNCLVNAFTLGLLKADRIFRGTASGVGNPVIYIGARTGRDGIHGATMSSAEFDEETESKRPTVQVGDPFMEKLLLEACLELFKTDTLVGIQDMGAAGLTSSSIEMASRAGSGLWMDLSLIPMRETGMNPYELMLSESQERMLLVAKKGREAEVLAICEKWDLAHAVVGKVTDTGRIQLAFDKQTVVDLPTAPLTDDAPQYDRPRKRPEWQDEVQRFELASIAAPDATGLKAALHKLLSAPTIASKKWVYQQYDHMVRVGTAVRPGDGDAAVVRFTGQREGGVALSVDCNSRWVYLDPKLGAAHAVAESARNVSCVGGEPLAITDCLNFGNPQRPEILWQFEQACLGIGEACTALGTPVVSGNVSLYNETDGKAVYPTPTIGMVGLVDDCKKHAQMGFIESGDVVAMLGPVRGSHLGASEYLRTVHGLVKGSPPPLDYAHEKAASGAVRALVRAGLVKTAHDISDGGLAVALAEMCFAKSLGAQVDVGALASGERADVALFGEDTARIVIALKPAQVAEAQAIATSHHAGLHVLGTVGGERLQLKAGAAQLVDESVAELHTLWSRAIPKVVGE
ncbi:MAG: phosphoribosylformylglycinamidine synthase subunit PurL [Deltaproteobacteria bacterium]|nr:phosphoribosylformylglycinamidine synthase subunit PurL [Deltaproteobacteria bacterium]